jgi:hypothetical protein
MSPIDNRFLKNPSLLGTFSTRETMVFPFAPLPPHRRTSDKAVVTWVAGEKAYEWFSVTGPAMKRYASRVGADFVVLDGFAGQPYLLASKFRVQQVLTEYGYDRILYVDADALIQDHCVDFFSLVPATTSAFWMRDRCMTSGRWRSTAARRWRWLPRRAARSPMPTSPAPATAAYTTCRSGTPLSSTRQRIRSPCARATARPSSRPG